ncbi:hypothetical protein [Roseibium sp. RKSG952]|uniref:hypothetical protein n=1 Tax=Roseibium sp. RKSG952 TaxID=2529384 RepID=UPI0012BC3701|nr:hypothetical protein [Roseibium sp. RKSG952]MTH99881.1 hypothetical protein [Roseibium sp. RKSG952]
MTNFKAVMTLCGLTTEDAAVYLNVAPGTVLRWCTLPESPPREVWYAMIALSDSIRVAAEEAAKSADLDNLTVSDLNNAEIVPPDLTLQGEGQRGAIAAIAVTALARAVL